MPPLRADPMYPMADAYLAAQQQGGRQPTAGYSRMQRSEFGDIQASYGTLAGVTIRGRANVSGQGALISGQTAYDTGTGFWIESNSGSPRFSIGNSSGNKLTFDTGTGIMSLTGSITASAGTVGGWTVGSSNLTGGDANLHSSGYLNLGTGSNIVRADATDATYRLWVGNATAASAPFRVTKTGAITSTSGDIGGFAIASTTLSATNFTVTSGAANTANLTVGSGSNAGGINSANGSSDITLWSGATFASRASAPFRVTAAGAITSTSGTIGGVTINSTDLTVPSGAKIKFGVGAGDYLDDNLLFFSVTSTESGKIRMQRSGYNRHAVWYNQDDGTNIYGEIGVTTATVALNGNYSSVVFQSSVSFDSTGVTYINAVDSGGSKTPQIIVDAPNQRVDISATNRNVRFDNTNRRALFNGYVYPGYDNTTNQTTGYFDWDNTNSRLRASGAILATTHAIFPGDAGSGQTANSIAGASGNLLMRLGDTGGTNQFHVADSAGQVQFAVTSNGGFASPDADGTALGSYSGRIPWYIAGNLRYIPYYNA